MSFTISHVPCANILGKAFSKKDRNIYFYFISVSAFGTCSRHMKAVEPLEFELQMVCKPHCGSQIQTLVLKGLLTTEPHLQLQHKLFFKNTAKT